MVDEKMAERLRELHRQVHGRQTDDLVLCPTATPGCGPSDFDRIGLPVEIEDAGQARALGLAAAQAASRRLGRRRTSVRAAVAALLAEAVCSIASGRAHVWWEEGEGEFVALRDPEYLGGLVARAAEDVGIGGDFLRSLARDADFAERIGRIGEEIYGPGFLRTGKEDGHE